MQCPCCGGLGVIAHHTELRRLRLAKGISLRDVAKALNFSASYLSDIELGRRRPSVKITKYYQSL